jgi:glycerate 2-kinase
VSIGSGKAGRGGRNTELLLSAAITLDSAKNVWALAGDTDGIDGTEDAAGALISPTTFATVSSLDARRALQDHDSYSFFARTKGLVMTGPTLTNVNDFRAFLVLPMA